MKRFGSMIAVVSSGYGLWALPVRIGPAPEIVVLHIKRKLQ
jgi:predicted MPP superfamily phosphohydrolase